MILQNGNCLELMKDLPDKSIDLFICDLPYGETNCKWDSKIDMDEFWLELDRKSTHTHTPTHTPTHTHTDLRPKSWAVPS